MCKCLKFVNIETFPATQKPRNAQHSAIQTDWHTYIILHITFYFLSNRRMSHIWHYVTFYCAWIWQNKINAHHPYFYPRLLLHHAQRFVQNDIISKTFLSRYSAASDMLWTLVMWSALSGRYHWLFPRILICVLNYFIPICQNSWSDCSLILSTFSFNSSLTAVYQLQLSLCLTQMILLPYSLSAMVILFFNAPIFSFKLMRVGMNFPMPWLQDQQNQWHD